MALARCNQVVQDDVGNIVNGATIEVRFESTGTLAPLFSDRDGVVGKSNPFTAADGTDAGFHVAGGSYKITATLGGFQRIRRYVGIGTAGEADASSFVAASALAGVPFATVGPSAVLDSEYELRAGQGVILDTGGSPRLATFRRASENTVLQGLDWPVSNDQAVRIAAGVDGLSYGVVYHGGNGLWLYDTFGLVFRPARIPGAFQIVNLTSCTINGVAAQARVAGTLYYIYAYFAAASDVFASYELSTTAPTTGDPLGATNVTGWHFKNDGTRNKRLVGFCKSDAGGAFWHAGSRGVFMSGISSYDRRQCLNYHTKVSGGNASTTWAEINSQQYLSAASWDDGDEPFIALSGSVQSTSAGAVVSVGICIDGVTTPFDFVDVYCAVANQPYPFCVVVTAGDFATDLHTYRVFMKNSAGTGSITGDRNGCPATGATFAMKLEQ